MTGPHLRDLTVRPWHRHEAVAFALWAEMVLLMLVVVLVR